MSAPTPFAPKGIPVLAYVNRNKALLLSFVAAFLLFKWEAAFQAGGPSVFLPMLFVQSVLVATFVRHFFYRGTLDNFALSGDFARAWVGALSPAERVRWTLGSTLALIYCSSNIAAALAK